MWGFCVEYRLRIPSFAIMLHIIKWHDVPLSCLLDEGNGKYLTKLHTVFFLFLCEHTWEQPSAYFVIFQLCHRCFQCPEPNIQFHTQFPGNQLTCVDKLMETLLVVWCAIHDHLEGGLSFTLLSSLLERITHHPTVLTSTVFSP